MKKIKKYNNGNTRGRILKRLLGLTLFFALIAPSSLSFISGAFAGVPVKFTYQGNIRQNGFLVTGSKNIRFRIYNSSDSATSLWTSPVNAVNVSTGVFKFDLEPSISDWESGSLWLELEIEGTVLSPREEVTSSPYSVNSLLHSGKKYTTSVSTPGSPSAGDLWMDSLNNTLRFYTGAEWRNTDTGDSFNHADRHSGSGADSITSLGAHAVTGPMSLDNGATLSAGAGATAVVIGSDLSITGAVNPDSNLSIGGGGYSVTFASSVIASEFYGDGSALTDLTVANIGAGLLPSDVIASSIAVNAVQDESIVGMSSSKLIGALPAINGSALTGIVATNVTAAGVQDGELGSGVIASSIAVNAVQDESIVGMSSSKLIGALPAINGSALTDLTVDNIGAGLLPSDVIASSIAVNAVHAESIKDSAVTDAKINDVAGGKITGAGTIIADRIAAGSLGSEVIASSIAVGAIDNSNQIANGIVSNDDLAGSIDPLKVTGTAAILGANTFTGVQTYEAGSSIMAAANQDGVTISTVIYIGSGANISTITPTGFYGDGSGLENIIATNVTAAGVQAGELGSEVIASSIAVGAIDNSNQIANGIVSNDDLAGSIDPLKVTGTAAILGANIFTGVQTYEAGSSIMAATNQDGVTISTVIYIGSGANISTITPTGFHGDGSNLTGITATNVTAAGVQAGELDSDVIASSIAVNAVYTASIKDSAITKAKISADSCVNGDILELSGGVWVCGTDTTGADAMTTKEGGAAAVLATAFMDFDGDQFNVSESPADEANIVLDASSVTLQGNTFNAANKLLMLDGSGELPALNGSNLTGLTAANIGAGLLTSDVIASSIAVNAVHTESIKDSAVTDAKINDVAGGKITGAGTIIADRIAAGELGSEVIVSSIAVGAIDNSNQIVNGIVSNDDLAGSIDPLKVTGTAAILGANIFTGVQTYEAGSSIMAAANQDGVTISTVIYIGSGANISTITPTGFYGDGSNLSNVPSDNLGNHIATTTLQMGAYGVNTSSDISAARYQINGSTVVAILQGVGNIGIGVDAGRINTGNMNSFLGYEAGYSNTSGHSNSFVGYQAGKANTTGGYNSFFGREAGIANTTGSSNVFGGYRVAYNNTTGKENVFGGYEAGYNNTVGSLNSFMGYNAGYMNTTGENNSAFGARAGWANETGSANAIFGVYAGGGAEGVSYSSSTLIGYKAGFNLSANSGNILLGFQAGDSLTTGASNIIIGYDEDAPTAATNNHLNIGGIITGDLASGEIYIGSGANISTITPTGFHGDGSGLENVTATDNTKVLKAGDTMSGSLAVSTLTTITDAIVFAPYVDSSENYASGHGVSIGSDTISNYTYGIGIGYAAKINYGYGIGMGYESNTNHTSGVGIGNSSYGNYSYAVGIGYQTRNNFNHGIGIGRESSGNEDHGVGLGAYTNGNANFAVGIGAYSQNNEKYGVGLGAYAVANSSSVALGSNAKANAERSLAFGAETVNNSTGTASFGVYAIETSSSVTADKFYGDGSGLNNLAGDSLGSHIATTTLNMATFDIDVSTINAKGANGLFLFDDGGNGIFVEDGGNVGIGTTDPAYKLEVKDAGESFQIEPQAAYISLRVGGVEVARMRQ